MKALSVLVAALFACCLHAGAQVAVKIEDVNKHIGDTVKICTKIYSARYLPRVPGSPTYLEAGNAYPANTLNIFIAKKDRGNFESEPEMMYVYKEVCVTGKLELENGKAKITVTNPAQIAIKKD